MWPWPFETSSSSLLWKGKQKIFMVKGSSREFLLKIQNCIVCLFCCVCVFLTNWTKKIGAAPLGPTSRSGQDPNFSGGQCVAENWTTCDTLRSIPAHKSNIAPESTAQDLRFLSAVGPYLRTDKQNYKSRDDTPTTGQTNPTVHSLLRTLCERNLVVNMLRKRYFTIFARTIQVRKILRKVSPFVHCMMVLLHRFAPIIAPPPLFFSVEK